MLNYQRVGLKHSFHPWNWLDAICSHLVRPISRLQSCGTGLMASKRGRKIGMTWKTYKCRPLFIVPYYFWMGCVAMKLDTTWNIHFCFNMLQHASTGSTIQMAKCAIWPSQTSTRILEISWHIQSTARICQEISPDQKRCGTNKTAPLQ